MVQILVDYFRGTWDSDTAANDAYRMRNIVQHTVPTTAAITGHATTRLALFTCVSTDSPTEAPGTSERWLEIASDVAGDHIHTVPEITGLQSDLDAKQDNLTFDTTPTASSTNPVTSGGLFTELNTRQANLTFDSIPITASLNPVTSGGLFTEFETKQDNLTFDATPITASTNPVASGGLFTEFETKQDNLTFDVTPTTDSLNPVTSGGLFTEFETKQDNLTFDTTPTTESLNPVTSGGLFTEFETKQDNLTFDTVATENSINPVTSGGLFTELEAKHDTLTFDATPTTESLNPVTSGGIFTEFETKQDNLTFDTVATQDSLNPVTSGGLFAELSSRQINLVFDATPIENSMNPATSGGLFTEFETKQDNLTFDTVATVNSLNPVTSGGLFAELEAKHDTLTFDTVATQDSLNPVTSGGLFTELSSRQINLVFDATPIEDSMNPATSGGLFTEFETKQDNLTFDVTPTTASTNPVTSGGLFTEFETKQDNLTFDTTPAASSTNPVTSGGLFTEFETKQDNLTFDATPITASTNPVTSAGLFTEFETKQDNLTFDTTPTTDSLNPITSGGLLTEFATKQDNLTFDLVSTTASTNPVTSGGLFTEFNAKQDALQFSSLRTFTASEITFSAGRMTFARESTATRDLIVDLFENIEGTNFSIGTQAYTFTSILFIQNSDGRNVVVFISGLDPTPTASIFNGTVSLQTSAQIDGTPNEIVAGSNIDFTTTANNQLTISTVELQPTISYIHQTVNFTAQVDGLRTSNSDPIAISNIVGADIADIIAELNDEELHEIIINGIVHTFTGSFGAELQGGSTTTITTTNTVAVVPPLEDFPAGTAVTINLLSQNFAHIVAGSSIQLTRDTNNDLVISSSDDSTSDTHDTLEGQLDVNLKDGAEGYVIQTGTNPPVPLPSDGQSVASYLPNSRELYLKISTTILTTPLFTVGELIGNNTANVADQWVGRILTVANRVGETFVEIRVLSGGDVLRIGEITAGVYIYRQDAVSATNSVPLFTVVRYTDDGVANGDILTWIESADPQYTTFGGYWTGTPHVLNNIRDVSVAPASFPVIGGGRYGDSSGNLTFLTSSTPAIYDSLTERLTVTDPTGRLILGEFIGNSLNQAGADATIGTDPTWVGQVIERTGSQAVLKIVHGHDVLIAAASGGTSTNLTIPYSATTFTLFLYSAEGNVAGSVLTATDTGYTTALASVHSVDTSGVSGLRLDGNNLSIDEGAPTFDPLRPVYRVGATVLFHGLVYICQRETFYSGTNHVNPAADTRNWRKVIETAEIHQVDTSAENGTALSFFPVDNEEYHVEGIGDINTSGVYNSANSTFTMHVTTATANVFETGSTYTVFADGNYMTVSSIEADVINVYTSIHFNLNAPANTYFSGLSTTPVANIVAGDTRIDVGNGVVVFTTTGVTALRTAGIYAHDATTAQTSLNVGGVDFRFGSVHNGIVSTALGLTPTFTLPTSPAPDQIIAIDRENNTAPPALLVTTIGSPSQLLVPLEFNTGVLVDDYEARTGIDAGTSDGANIVSQQPGTTDSWTFNNDPMGVLVGGLTRVICTIPGSVATPSPRGTFQEWWTALGLPQSEYDVAELSSRPVAPVIGGYDFNVPGSPAKPQIRFGTSPFTRTVRGLGRRTGSTEVWLWLDFRAINADPGTNDVLSLNIPKNQIQRILSPGLYRFNATNVGGYWNSIT